MSTYVLVHGEKNAGEIWNKATLLLEQHDNKVFCPSLPDAYTHVTRPYPGSLQFDYG